MPGGVAAAHGRPSQRLGLYQRFCGKLNAMPNCAACGEGLRAGAPFCPHCGADVPDDGRLAEATDPLIGMVLARKFKVLSVLGEGGMGKVYKAEQQPLGVDVVIKTLHAHMARDADIVKRFFREAQAASRLRHPNCISVLDFGDSDGTLYIAMEFLRGRSLSQTLAEVGCFDPPRLLRVIAQLLDVLEAAHQIQIVHRDLKPDNIMVEDLATQRDFVKVLDFGIAKLADAVSRGGTKLTKTGMVFGTPAYMAPEQAMAVEVDHRADLYAVGCICFELLTGRVPFLENNPAMLLAAHATQPAPPLLTVRSGVPKALAALIDRALAKSPEDRPQSALLFKQELELAASAAAGTAPPTAVGAALSAPSLPPEGVQVGLAPCPRCGEPVSSAAKFCGECGASTGRQTAADHLKDKLSDLRRFLPSGLVDDLAEMRSSSRGEKRDVVALVADVSGAAAHRDRDPEQVSQLKAQLFQTLTDIALRHTGHLERSATGGCIVLFGLMTSHGDDAERAVAAAVDMRQAGKEFAAAHDLTIHLTIAVHAGQAVVEAGRSGPAYSPIGDTLELPTRMAGAIAEGKIVVSERVHKLVQGSIDLRKHPPLALKGQTGAVGAYEVLGQYIVAGARQVTLAEPAFVGRDHDVHRLVQIVEQAEAGQVVQITGEPGSGKSRLLAQLRIQLLARQHLAIDASARPGPNRTSPAPARIVAAAGGSTDALRAAGLGPADVRLLAEYCGQPPVFSQLGDDERRTAVVAALRAVLERMARRKMVALLVDDVHLGDAIIAELVRRCITDPIARVTLVVTVRPGYPVPWEAARDSAQMLALPIAPLADAAISALVEGALAPTAAPRELKDAVVARAGGSPLMALEVLRALIDQGVLVSIGGRWAVTGDLARVGSPEGLQALYAGRIDALPAYARDVLTSAAVVGSEFRVVLINHIIAQAHGNPIDREVQLLTARGFFAETDRPGLLRFREHSAREAVYGRLTREARRGIHRAVAMALDAMQEPEIPPEVVGDHYFLGGDVERALNWLGRAADEALATRQLRRAERILRRASEAARADMSGVTAAERNRRLADDSLRLGEVLLDLGDLNEIGTVLSDGLVAAHKDDDPLLIARVRRARGRAYMALANVDAARTDLEAALKASIRLRDPLLIADLHADLGELYEKCGDQRAASEYMLRALELVQSGANQDVQTRALRVLTGLGRVCLRSGEADRAQRFLQQALALAEELGDQLGAAKVLGNLAGVYHARSEFQTAVQFVSRALELSREIGDQVGTARQLNNLGTLYSLLGDSGEALRNYDAAFAAARRAGWREGMATAAAGRDRLRV
jgi:tetratricopeptide (TPR) repeat protein/tRNA A-37 threonylcarbamoyl transferase component Bud32